MMDFDFILLNFLQEGDYMVIKTGEVHFYRINKKGYNVEVFTDLPDEVSPDNMHSMIESFSALNFSEINDKELIPEIILKNNQFVPKVYKAQKQ